MISILMATYNGEKYISEQIESILNQTERNIKIFISDDCSTDRTLEIIQFYARKFPQKIVVSQSEKNSGNAKNNFLKLMTAQRDDYIMLCDQDDVWLDNKIEVTLYKMKEMEQMYGAKTPLLVHTDLKVVDENLKILSESYRKAMNANYNKTDLRNQLIQNTLTGCTAMYNRSLAELLSEQPRFIIMHDWWLILVASAFGKIGHVNQQTILYRQHSNNVVGAKNLHSLFIILEMMKKWESLKRAIDETYLQAESLYEVYSHMLSMQQKKLIREYCSIPQIRYKLGRLIKVLHLKTLKNGFVRIMAQLLLI